ncbi:hypothetical protein AALP_AA8G387000 [Arabis alpina]|uniref:Uncharacterized protein n=1 Tax=Arabis alpina TaxID=50452 RepID=A0A087GC64_ARAAL|nr:hypothetical protein AALP_AA8G387000 [Arabis alpina]
MIAPERGYNWRYHCFWYSLKSGQVLIVQRDSIVIRSAKPYLATPGAKVHGHYREILYHNI